MSVSTSSTVPAMVRRRRRRQPSKMGKPRGAYQRGLERGRVGLRQRRLSLNLSQDQVAATIVLYNAQLGLPVPAPLTGVSIGRYESGRATPRECWLDGYAAALHIPLDRLEHLLDLPLVHL